ncbi:hypothetical protein COY52_10400 [Candidatus Desantisbacteria bacterium CG_4_10_14_0_8_um_filter_48_22]|uniref:Peptidase A2 domain-containing protein n=1 Tax=Candidatus Desantisbacteria bacterium CG_4_10_14_0_8_um_filter_48_22 TaxID=1974543 RepID=A0A2M7S6J8_9BACT|nr:MAG: hypothetical protein COS16_01725 [Candidatus Desantisbacteria bacterium CG02_land_8_20_14_3_00_49_13]PIZ15134.1 MAG: hypothetical protein COY52_10400 [Candidatus Desantisbacteria bacterium CG_4_10_14_0_8_um_filter_48_22]
MYSIIFPYKERQSFLMPIIPLILSGKGIQLATEAFVDSGATYSIFDLKLAEILAFDLKTARKQMFVVGNGGFIPGYIINIYMQIAECRFKTDVAFSDKLNVGFNLIGRKGIFENFSEIIFRENKKEIEFKY